jgi:hypothetical protein
MKKSHKRGWTSVALVLVATLAVLLGGCAQLFDSEASSESQNEGAGDGSVSIQMDLSAAAVSIEEVKVTLTNSSTGAIVSEFLTVDSANSTASGTIGGLADGTWDILAELFSGGFLAASGTGSATIESGGTASATITLSAPDTLPTGTVEGTVIDATTGEGLDGVAINVEGSADGEYETTTSVDGSFSFTTPIGNITLLFTLEGYVFPDLTVDVSEGQTTSVPQSEAQGSPNVAAGGIRMVLTWGESPTDLDSHLWTPSGDHIYYGNQAPADAGANLDLDDVTSYGPETITITEAQSGTYVYAVYNFSGTPEITTSNAQVQLYDSSGLVQTFSVPGSGTGRWWNLIELSYDGSGFDVTVINTIQETNPGPTF